MSRNGPLLFMGSAALIAFTLYAVSAPPPAPRVIDGDTLAFGDRHVRLWGIDAPELEQKCTDFDGSSYSCGVAARVVLQSLIAQGPVTCSLEAHDLYGRDVSVCTLELAELPGIDLAEQMVAAGWALDWPRYSSGHYAGAQAMAKVQKLGLWRGSFDLPWEWRWQNAQQKR